MANFPLMNFLSELSNNANGLGGLLHQIAGRKDTFPNFGEQPDQPATMGGSAKYTVQPQVHLQGVTPAAQQAWDSLAASWTGDPLDVASAYRSPEYNAKVGGARDSQHTHGNAFDVDTSQMPRSEVEALIRNARQQGFNGIGVYDDGKSIHLDVRPQTAVWGPNYHASSAPDWAKAVVYGDDTLSGGEGSVDTLRGGLTMTPGQSGAGGNLPALPNNQGFLANMMSRISPLFGGHDPTSITAGGTEENKVGATTSDQQGSTVTQGVNNGTSNTTGTSSTRSTSGLIGLPTLNRSDFELTPEQEKKNRLAAMFGVTSKAFGQMSHGDAVDVSEVLRDYQQRRQDAFTRSAQFAQEQRLRAPSYNNSDTTNTSNTITGDTSNSRTDANQSTQGTDISSGNSQSVQVTRDELEAKKAYMLEHPGTDPSDISLFTTPDGKQFMVNKRTGNAQEVVMPAGTADSNALPPIPTAPPRSQPPMVPDGEGGQMVDPNYTNEQANTPYAPEQYYDKEHKLYAPVNGDQSFGSLANKAWRGENALAKEAGWSLPHPEIDIADQYYAGLKRDIVGVMNSQIVGKTIAAQYSDIANALPDPTDKKAPTVSPQQAAVAYENFRKSLVASREQIGNQLQARGNMITPSEKQAMMAQYEQLGHVIGRINGALTTMRGPMADSNLPAGVDNLMRQFGP